MADKPIPQSQWPKPYLLQIMEAAIKDGCVRVNIRPVAEKMEKDPATLALSLIGSLNRIRRRSDKQHASFIRPEFHLISTTWEEERGTLLVTYSSLPDGHDLPKLESVSEEEKRDMPVPQAIEGETPALDVPEPGVFDPARLIDELLERDPGSLPGGS